MSAARSSPAAQTGPRRDAMRAMAPVLAIGWLLLAAFIVRALIGSGESPAQRLFATWISDAIAASAVAVCLWRAAVDRPERSIWGLAGVGIASWGLGNAYFEHTLASGASLPNPSPADIGYLGFYPLIYLAVIAARRRRAERLRTGQWLDGAIGAAACATAGAAFVLDPVIAATNGESLAGALTNIAYPIGDLTLLAMLVVTTATVGWRGARGLALLGAGMAVFAVSDTLYLVENANGTYQVGGVLDSGWLIGLMVMATGAALAATSVHAPRLRRRGQDRVSEHAIVPTLAGMVALVALALQPLAALNVTSIVCAATTLALVVTRMALSLRETAGLLAAREREAAHDPLTGLANRRVLLTDLSRRAEAATPESQALLVLFDLDGFKAYNDTFGHSAGDSLLIRVAGSLREAVGRRGRAYRIGGDEFCALLAPGESRADKLGQELADAMSQRGEGFTITASFGCALAPGDGRETTVLLRHADDEMYARKGRRRPGTESQVQDVLIAALSARDPGMESHANGVARLATAVGTSLDLSASDLRALSHAAALHDVGKIAIPDELLEKPGDLDEEERSFVQTHPLIAQRIISAAPALGYAAQIVRSVQERWDGGGYPDRLAGEEIPLAARIVGVCNAYQAMTSVRPHREPLRREEAIAELRRCAGTQFDPAVVEAFVAVLEHPDEHPAPALPTPTQAADLLVSRETAGRRRLQAQLSYQADHDLLTGLLNRRRFAEELERVLRYAARYQRSGALLVLDIDNLKLVNDLHGHAAGDEAVKLVAGAIRTRTRSTDIVGRLGGDELAVALHEAGEREALAVTDELRARLEELTVDPPLRASVGVALFDGDRELVADDLLTAADIALYDAKQAGGGQTRVYRGDTAAALKWVQRIRGALSDERFVLYAQPIVCLREPGEDGAELRGDRPLRGSQPIRGDRHQGGNQPLRGNRHQGGSQPLRGDRHQGEPGSGPHDRELRRELLVRMLSDDGDTIPPNSFIPTAERFGLITEIDRWVTAQGLALAGTGERVNINISARSMGDGGILEQVRSAVRAGLPRGRVVFEVTETAAMTNMQDARSFSQALNDLGCDVALDDFGTGFGSFSYLKHLPARYLKIDIEFVRDLVSNATDQRVVQAITDVGHSLGKLIVAEGVEDTATLEALREYGVDYAQGIYLGAPERITPATRWEREHCTASATTG